MNKISISIVWALNFVWMELGCQPPVFGFDLLIGCRMINPKVLVEIRRSANLPVCFVNCIQQICADHYYIYAPSVLQIFRTSRLWFRITSSYHDAIVNTLEPSCHHLQLLVLGSELRYIGKLTFGRKVHAARDSNWPDMMLNCGFLL